MSTLADEQKPHASIVLPCFNEEEHVLLEIGRICTARPPQPRPAAAARARPPHRLLPPRSWQDFA